MSLGTVRTAASLFLLTALLSPACVVRLSDRNAPLENGGVSGPSADCSTVQPLPAGGPSGPAATRFVGRYDLTKDATKPRFDWSGNYMTARFEGTEVTWGVEAGIEMVFEQIIDGKQEQIVLGGEIASKTVTRKLPAGTHEITVMRSSEALYSDCSFIPFTFGAGTTQLPPTVHPRRIEYIGDSITCGYGDEGPNATCPYDIPIRQVKNDKGQLEDVKIPETQNIYLAYGSLAARRLQADAVTLCFSGKGVYQNYREACPGEAKCPEGSKPTDPDAKTTIPQYYLRQLATESAAQYDFAKESPADRPQVVLINVGTNDFARDLDQNSVADGIDLGKFRSSYKEFVQFVRTKRPEAEIFLAVPPMVTDKFPLDNARTDLRNVLRSIAQDLNSAGDKKVYSMELVEMGVRYGLGCDYHPNLEVHRIMADQVVGAIRSKTCWSTTEAQ
ncbi:MAG: Acetylxylan esterase [Labilithrix sp.]|nr:Acetylxylan esterase [Labilithrix sp.]